MRRAHGCGRREPVSARRTRPSSDGWAFDACALRIRRIGSVTASRRDLPPLETLVAFDAAARHLSFTRAADEIALTQSAVSRQILALEARLGVPLFRRLPRALALTDAGATLRDAVRQALEGLARATRAVRADDAPRTVVVTTTAGFAGLWLIPRLSAFTARHPGVDVRISTGHQLASLERDGIDVAVRYQPVTAHASAGATPLFAETVTPVCAPRLLKAQPLVEPADLARTTLLRMEPEPGDPLQDWGLWLHATGIAGLQPAGVLHFSSYDQLVTAALAGQGVALGRLPLVAALLRGRRLVAPFAERAFATPRGYGVIVAPSAVAKPEVQAFAAWLADEARAAAPAARAAPRPRTRAAPAPSPAPRARRRAAARSSPARAPRRRTARPPATSP
jgi:LysR family glycine cleavage system transcriptional activator